MGGECGTNRKNRLPKGWQGESEAAGWRKGRWGIAVLVRARIEILVPGDIRVQRVVVVAHDPSGRPAIRSNTMMPLPPSRICLTRDARNEGARNPKHGKQSSPMAGHRRHPANTIHCLM